MPKGGKRTGSGRKRKPVEMRVIEGTFRNDRHGDAPRVDGGFPEAPAHLSAAEAELWRQFPRVPWIAPSDAWAVDGAVSVYERILSNRRRQPGADDDVAARLVDQEAKLWGRLMSILATLGLTPADRTKMQTPKADDADDKWAGIL